MLCDVAARLATQISSSEAKVDEVDGGVGEYVLVSGGFGRQMLLVVDEQVVELEVVVDIAGGVDLLEKVEAGAAQVVDACFAEHAVLVFEISLKVATEARHNEVRQHLSFIKLFGGQQELGLGAF